ncbi:hypothetical protein BY996DRAFT_4583657 [Phakopsora pachyrhizi]|uniref:MARVEL domain-containing protein n=1 Tax=Phakopsora pachyrhizi TaxID=170000 RepID=A0AAV0BKJ1_PHAPC|nr:hypothetical protein BY996DRAFT_4583657 [Phakopsora pachyrhizi]CAH7687737.1 hypothetical protein PPACK8108_LOCUS22567 [Phakopsora pachyrhizi]
MSNLIDRFRQADFTGLNRAFGRGKHSPKINNSQYESRGIAGGPNSKLEVSSSRLRSNRHLGRVVGPESVVGSGSGLDDDDTSPIQVIIRGTAVFFLVINTLIYIAIANFQKRWKVGPSGLTGLALFILIQALLHALALLAVPQIYERTDMLRGFSRAIRLTRIQFIIYGTQTGLTLILSLATTISAYTGGCKNPQDDPHASDKDYISNISGFCRNKRAAAAFWWFSFFTFAASLGIVFKSWYSIRKLGPNHSSFEPPQGVGVKSVADDDEDFRADDDEDHFAPPHREMSAVRPSNVGGYYGERPVFESDRVPSGYGTPVVHEVAYDRPPPPSMMPYKDPFDEIRAQIYQSGR